MTRADRLLVIALACIALAVSPVAGAREADRPGSRVLVVKGPEGISRLPMDRDATCKVQGLRGLVVVAISNGSARVTESFCRDEVCIRSGTIDSPGEAIACVPNGVVLTVEGGEAHLDAIVR